MKAPDFSLPDQNGTYHSLKDYAGKWLLVYFYPKDDTPGCTKEACNFRDDSEEYTKRNISVIGISKDTVTSHLKFSEKHALNFPLLADESTETIKAFGALGEKSMFGKKYLGILRNTYLINPDGEIVKEYKGVNPLNHSRAVLQEFDEMK